MARHSKNWQPKTEVFRFNIEIAIETYGKFREVFSKDQPLPRVDEISQNDFNKLEGCLGNISQQINGIGYLYKPGLKTAASYFYFVNKSHWLINGNKRSAIIFTLVYLQKHNKWLKMDWNKLYELAKDVAKFNGELQTKNTTLFIRIFGPSKKSLRLNWLCTPKPTKSSI